MNDPCEHGGALDVAVARFGGPRADWLDLSTGINPAPPPLPAIQADAWTRLPERVDEAGLLAAARRFYGAPEAAGIVAAPGSQMLITQLPLLFAPCEAAVVGPTYSEHARALAAAGHRVREIGSLDGISETAMLAIVINPNNPDGRRCSRTALLAVAERMAGRGGLLVVDEAFADADPAVSLAPFSGRAGLLVHRSFGKFFGLAGLRLGFALTTLGLAETLAARLGPWAVSGPALAIAANLMSDRAVIEGLRCAIARQAALRRSALQAAGCEIVGETALFALVRHDSAHLLFDALCRRHLLTRPFSYRADWLRIGNPCSADEAARLETALREALTEVTA
ncbi:threonine-phosphate decarboxylase CobD [Consotaella salsifontis]|uniref:threonine-phosphate decarboxylase n=1 Tax=Consotaella salsifontis TaxID=1365950 RepID=A0A1T4SIX4_9HYPH|nr:threonine-phosphate decarboxylase CobD [Consotaella salsifontis]SKA28260.1 L-threonine O-3-phosphate decarboxylase [Consotaella salsifontis]